MVSDLVEATPKLSADCFLAMKLRPPDEALGRVGEARSAVQEWGEGEGQQVFGRHFSQEGSDLNIQCVQTWFWRK